MKRASIAPTILVVIVLSGVASGGQIAAVGGVTVEIPTGWVANPDLAELGGPLMLSTVPVEKYGHGGILPPNEAQITVRLMAASEDGPEATLTKAVKLTPDDQAQKATEKLGANDAACLSYTWDSMDGMMYFDYAVIHVGKQAVVFALVSRGRNDASRAEFKEKLRDVVASAVVTEKSSFPEGGLK